ncbi:MAG: hypothetical protein ABIW76_22630, partial [Fibrobacteria bacterium]
MKMSKSAQLLTGLGLAAGLFWGCQDLLSQKDDPSSGTPVTADETVLSLSIKDDPACREQWNSILAARTNGHPDSMAESAFLSGCVKEIKAGKDKIPPIIPPGLVPDSLSRCHWIVAQIEGGRNEMTVSYKRYCPNDCRKLEDKDSVRHEHLCRDSGVDTTKPPRDTVKVPRDTIEKPPHPNTSECAAIKLKLSMAKPGEPGRADLERMFKMHCLDSIPPKPTDP